MRLGGHVLTASRRHIPFISVDGTLVYNLRSMPGDSDAVRIDRGTRWGNPFRIGRDGDRTEVAARYRRWLWQRIEAGEINLGDLAALHGRSLACWCAPAACHGEVLARAAAWARCRLDRLSEPGGAARMSAREVPMHEILRAVRGSQSAVSRRALREGWPYREERVPGRQAPPLPCRLPARGRPGGPGRERREEIFPPATMMPMSGCGNRMGGEARRGRRPPHRPAPCARNRFPCAAAMDARRHRRPTRPGLRAERERRRTKRLPPLFPLAHARVRGPRIRPLPPWIPPWRRPWRRISTD